MLKTWDWGMELWTFSCTEDDSDSQSLALIISSLKMVDYMFSLLLCAWRGSI